MLSTIQDRFEEFHAANPTVYTTLVKLARQAKAKGRRVGIRHLWDVMRWEMFMNVTDEDSDYKLNDIYYSRYSRLIMDTEKDLDGFFEIRELRRP